MGLIERAWLAFYIGFVLVMIASMIDWQARPVPCPGCGALGCGPWLMTCPGPEGSSSRRPGRGMHWHRWVVVERYDSVVVVACAVCGKRKIRAV